MNHLIQQVDNVRDKAIISLFADLGLKLSELATIKLENIDWQERRIKVKCKGNQEGLAVFGLRIERQLKK